jgi:hypothetical protein
VLLLHAELDEAVERAYRFVMRYVFLGLSGDEIGQLQIRRFVGIDSHGGPSVLCLNASIRHAREAGITLSWFPQSQLTKIV